MKNRQFLSALLASLLLCNGCLTGCGSNTEETTAAPAVSSPEAETPAETEPEDPWPDDLPEKMDLDGRTMRIMVRTEDFASNEIAVEEMTGEVINDAVFTRNSNVCDRLNVNIEQELTRGGADNSASQALTNLVTAGSDDFDLFCSNSYTTVLLAVNGILTELTQLEHLDLTKEYWSQGFNETASIGGKQYICTGPMALGFYRYLMVGLFNKSLFDRFGVEYPYDTVLEGGWTLEAQNALAQVFYTDTNGDGTRDADDTYGFYTRASNDTSINDGYWGSLNLRTISKDENGYYVYDINQENFVNGLDNLLALMTGDGSFSNAANDTAIHQKFSEGTVAMCNARLHVVEDDKLRSMEDDYGVLPLPKADENQENYYSLAQDQFLVYAIPLSVQQTGLEDIGMFLEAFASESYKVVRPAYYEIALTSKYMNDAESAAMLDLVANNMYIDPAILYLSYFNLNVGTLRNILKAGENTIASTIASNQKVMAKTVDKLNKSYGAE